MTPKAILFDMFDTLMLIEKNHEFYSPSLMRMYQFLLKNGIRVPFEQFNSTYIDIRDELYAKANLNWEEPHFNVRIAATLQKLGYNYDVSNPIVVGATNEFCEEFMKYVKIDKDTETVLNELHGRYKLGMISNFAIPECVLNLLRKNGIEKFFDTIVVSGAVNKRKPSEEIFKNTLRMMGVTPSETIFVGDTIDADVEGPKAVGMKAIHIKRREQKPSEKFCPDQTITSLRELPKVIERC